MNDIIPPHKRRSIRDIPIPEKSDEKEPISSEDQQPHHDNKQAPKKESVRDDLVIEKTHEDDDSQPSLRKTPSKEYRDSLYVERNTTPKKIVLGSVFVAILAFFIVLAFRNGAEVIVEPKQVEATIATELQAFSAEDSAEQDVTFTTEVVTVEVSETITATGEETVTEEASGQITIYNEYSDESQRLIAQTRFESPEGNIYRIQESVTVPGQTTDGPGTITVTVVADEAGDNYNIGKTSFTIPGFAGQPQFDSMYAKSETAMTGGYDGVRKFVEEDAKKALETSLQEQALTALTQKIDTLDDNQYVFSTSSLQSFNLTQSDGSDTVTFTMSGEAVAVVLQKDILANAIASASLTTFDIEKENVSLLFGDNFSLTITPVITPGSDREITSVAISADGPLTFLWNVDTTTLADALAGTERKTFRNILESIPSVQKAEVTIRPFWKNSFPENAKKITITVKEVDA